MKKTIIILVLTILLNPETRAQENGYTEAGKGRDAVNRMGSAADVTPVQGVLPENGIIVNSPIGSAADITPDRGAFNDITVNNQTFSAAENKSSPGTGRNYIADMEPHPELKISGNFENVISEIEKNNTTLQALRQQLEARRLENRTGIFLPDPEAGFNYLWGDPSVIGNRVNISLTQSFDFPTAYKYRNQISHIRNDQLNLEYNNQLRAVIFEARLVLTDLIYYNNLNAEYKRRLSFAMEIASSFRAKLDEGETGLPDYNKAQLNLLNIEKELETIRIEREMLLSELALLNGGQELMVADTSYDSRPLPDEFSVWYQQAEQENPMLQWLAMEIEISSKQEKLSTALGLPSFHAGYMSESVGGQSFRGIAAGITIPLWENRNTLQTARARTKASQESAADNKLQFYHHLQAQYEKAVTLKKSLEVYRQGLDRHDNTILLKKAMDLGQISLSEYILELSIYYDSIDSLLKSERELQTAIAHLYRYY